MTIITSRRFESQLFEYFGNIQQLFRAQPIILGGVAGPSGGVGGPPGGFIGYLPQTRVSYDTTEAATDYTPVSGMSLLDNLNHIRYQIQQITVSGGATVLDDLTDVDTSGKADGQVLTWDNDTSNWVASGIGPGGGATVLDDLTDVDTAGKTDGQVLTWDSDTSLWTVSGITIPTIPDVLEDLSNVDTAGKTDGMVLTWDNDTTMWVASGIAAVPSGGVVNLNDLQDVDTAGKDIGEFLSWSGTLWVASGVAITASGGGDSTTTDTYANRPATGNDGNLFFPNNSFVVERDTGTVWQPWGPLFPMTPPISGEFSWQNQGDASIDTTHGGNTLYVPSAASVSIRIREKVAPSTPYTITAAFLFTCKPANYAFCSLGFKESGTGKLVHFRFGFNSSQGNWSITSVHSSSPTADVSAPYSTVWALQLLFLRITDDGTDLRFSVSSDGINFVECYNEGRTSYLSSPAYVFWGGDSRNSAPVYVNLLSWKEE